MIYLDAPTLTGYSYTTNPDVVRSSDTKSALQTAEFLRKVGLHLKYVNTYSREAVDAKILTNDIYNAVC